MNTTYSNDFPNFSKLKLPIDNPLKYDCKKDIIL